MNKILIFIPTYNEINNIDEIFNNIITLKINADLLFIDDNSPDGTGKYLDELAKNNKFLSVKHRPNKLGIGSAHKVGINYAYDNEYDYLVTLDCDMTHKPEYILDFFKISNQSDIVIGTRYLDKKSLETWGFIRKILTKAGHFATRFMLGMSYDATGSFRLYDLRKVSRSFVDKFQSNGYAFSFESLYILHLNNYSISEVSIYMPSRVLGNSKMKLSDAIHSVLTLFKLRLITIFNKNKLII